MSYQNSNFEVYSKLRKSKIAISSPLAEKKIFKNTARSILQRPAAGNSSGVVYLIREFISEEKNSQMSEKIATKIGYCKLGSIAQRLEDINKYHYRNLYIAYAEKVDDAKAVEFIMHLRYKKDNINGEWFNLSEYQIKDAIRFLSTENVKSGDLGDWYYPGHKDCIVAKENMHYFWDEVNRC
jgi:hypothetical protein